LDAGNTLLNETDHYTRQVCFFAQQAAEKSIKAIFVFLEMNFPYTHDLDRLRNLLPDGWHVKNKFPDLAGLTISAIEARYPGDAPDVVETDAKQALETTEGIYKIIEEDLSEQLRRKG
jgi:HEPN domain-containing protein